MSTWDMHRAASLTWSSASTATCYVNLRNEPYSKSSASTGTWTLVTLE